MQDDLYEPDKPKRGLPDETPYDESSDDEPIYGVPMDDYQGPRRRRRWPFIVALGCLGLCCLCCVAPLCVIVAGSAAIASFVDSATVTTSQTLRVPENEPVTLVVDNPVGDVTIRRGTDGEVEVTYTKTVYGLSQSSADQALDELELSVAQPDDSTVSITVQGVDGIDQFGDLFSLGNQIDLVIRVPERVTLEIITNVSDIAVENVQAERLTLQTNTGTIVFQGSLIGASDGNRISTNVGDITVRLPHDASVELSASTDVGDITVSEQFESVTRTGSAGSEVGDRWIGTLGSDSQPPALDLQSNTGDITVEVG